MYDASADNVISYLAYIAKRNSSSVATAYSHLSAIAYHYRIKGKNSITESTTVQMYMRGLKRRNISNPVKRARPMTPEILQVIMSDLGHVVKNRLL
jgi:hypothetical protein